MDLDFTPDQDTLRDSIRAVVSKEAPIALARAVAETGIGAEGFGRVVGELGWAALTVPEAFGGIGLGAIEAGILAEELGRVVAPGPLLATVTQFTPVVAALGSSEQQQRWLGAVASGSLAGTVGLHERDGQYSLASTRATAALDGGDVVLGGTKAFVIEATAVDEIACVVRGPGGIGVVIVPRDAVAITPIDSLDPTRRLAHVGLDGVRLPADRILGGPDAFGAHDAELADALLHAVCALALEIVGTCQTIFDIALEYAKERRQFGVAIGSFQAVKHKFADMIVALERARATGYLAALCLAEGDDRAALNVSVAKAAAGDCQRRLGKEGIQILGGIGYTWEHDMHLYVKRVKADDLLFGSGGHHRAHIAELLEV